MQSNDAISRQDDGNDIVVSHARIRTVDKSLPVLGYEMGLFFSSHRCATSTGFYGFAMKADAKHPTPYKGLECDHPTATASNLCIYVHQERLIASDA